MSKTITIPSDPDTETLISAIDMVIEAQDNGYPILVTNDNETQGVLYEDAKNFKVMAIVLGIEFDMVALRRKALEKEYEAIGESCMLQVGFVESSEAEARKIQEATGKPVFCVETNELYY